MSVTRLEFTVPVIHLSLGIATMNDFASYNPIEAVRIERCSECQKAPMLEIAHADSLKFGSVTHYLLRCENATCNAHAWTTIGGNEGKPWRVLIRKRLRRTSIQNPILLKSVPLNASTVLPDEITSAFDEAFKCYQAEAHTACAAMFRRTLESALIARGAEPRARLPDMIAQLSDRGKLPPETGLLCEEIRLYGNPASHAGESSTQEDANDVLWFADIVLAWLYGSVIPVSGQKSDSN